MSKIPLYILLILVPLPAWAYIGPGIGLGVIASILGFIGAFFLAIFAILYYPIKRALNKRKAVKAKQRDSFRKHD